MKLQRETEELRKRLKNGYENERRKRPAGSSAVMIPIVVKDGEYELLFEVRASSLRSQPGEVCFPGGRIESGEGPKTAALREMQEELLVEREQIEVIGMLDPTNGPANAPLWAYIAILHDYNGTYSASEVDHVFQIPLKWFEGHEPRHYFAGLMVSPGEDFPYDEIPGGRGYPWKMKKHEIMFYDTSPVIWGMTARLICHLVWMLEAGTEKK